MAGFIRGYKRNKLHGNRKRTSRDNKESEECNDLCIQITQNFLGIIPLVVSYNEETQLQNTGLELQKQKKLCASTSHD